jgi:hypothetical protein
MKFIKKKTGTALGFRTPDFFKQGTISTKSGKNMGKFNPSQFKTQHRGGS